MKRIRCPKCDEAIVFDETKYKAGDTLVFECPECRKQFKVRIGVKAAPAKTAENMDGEEEERREELGHLVVIENAFHFRQEVPLYEGENTIGRFVRGTQATAPIKTVDPSVDTTHCRINVTLDKMGKAVFVLSDGPSGTGTFLMNELLGNRDRVRIEDGAIITLGATTMILRTKDNEEEEE